jgi:hypothetical protein
MIFNLLTCLSIPLGYEYPTYKVCISQEISMVDVKTKMANNHGCASAHCVATKENKEGCATPTGIAHSSSFIITH